MEAQPAIITRTITVKGVTIPANTNTTAQLSAGDKDLCLIWFKGKAYLVKTNSVRFL